MDDHNVIEYFAFGRKGPFDLFYEDEKLMVLKTLKKDKEVHDYIFSILKKRRRKDSTDLCIFIHDCVRMNVIWYAYILNFRVENQTSNKLLEICLVNVVTGVIASTIFRFVFYPRCSIYRESPRRWDIPKVEYFTEFYHTDGNGNTDTSYEDCKAAFNEIGRYFSLNLAADTNEIIQDCLQKSSILLSSRLVDVYLYNQGIVNFMYQQLLGKCRCRANFKSKLCSCEELCQNLLNYKHTTRMLK